MHLTIIIGLPGDRRNFLGQNLTTITHPVKRQVQLQFVWVVDGTFLLGDECLASAQKLRFLPASLPWRLLLAGYSTQAPRRF